MRRGLYETNVFNNNQYKNVTPIGNNIYNLILLDDELLEIAISQNDSSGKCRDKEHKTSHNKLSGKNWIIELFFGVTFYQLKTYILTNFKFIAFSSKDSTLLRTS